MRRLIGFFGFFARLLHCSNHHAAVSSCYPLPYPPGSLAARLASKPPLPDIETCTGWQRRSIHLALDYGVIAHRLFTATARGSGVRVYIALVVGDGQGHACSQEAEYQPGVERYVRVDRTRRIVCNCPLGERGKPCAHAGAILLQLLS